MTRDTISHGETYTLSANASDADGVAIALDETWLAACRICEDCVGGPLAVDVTMAIVDGAATGSIDSAILEVRNYFVDMRFTDEDGNDYWSDPWILIVRARNTPNS
jgi:hypothetical protein